MNKDRTIRTMSMMALLVAVVGVAVGLTALSAQFNLKGVARALGQKWSVTFSNVSIPVTTGSATVDSPLTISSGSTSLNLVVSLQEPGDSIIYLFDVVNNGNMNAKISAINLSGVSTAASKNISYTLSYANGDPIKINDSIGVKDKRKMKLTVIYNDDLTSLGDVTLNLGATITYVKL